MKYTLKKQKKIIKLEEGWILFDGVYFDINILQKIPKKKSIIIHFIQ